jgi:AraC-like DNA-binding protein
MTKLRVLVLESDPQLQPVLVAVLGPDAVVASSSPTRALDRTREGQPSVAIVSLPLPDCNYVLVVRALQRCLPTCPILLLSPRGRPLALAAFIGGVIQESPETIEQLMQRLELLLTSHHRRTGWIPQLSAHVLSAAEYLGRHYARSITVDEVAKASGISPGHLAHVFRLESGSTVKSRLRSVRIELARRLLADTDDTLEVIAHRVGFYDAAHMSRLFHHTLDVWPGAYRDRLRSGRSPVQTDVSLVQERRRAVH